MVGGLVGGDEGGVMLVNWIVMEHRKAFGTVVGIVHTSTTGRS